MERDSEDSCSVKIAAVFASFNRCEVAMECLERLRSQTRPLDLVVVGDNASEDGSAAAMRDLNWDVLQVIDTGGNLGNAGAVRIAMDHAFAEGADAVWILDDDSWPRADTLEIMLEEGWDPAVVLHPVQVDPKTGGFTWPLQLVHSDGSVELVSSIKDMPKQARARSRGVWTGAMISREVREKVGPVNGDLFIRGEDEEYPWRIECAGFTEEVVIGAMLDHPGPSSLIEWRFFGKRLFLERGLSDWKLYYKVRNMVWLKRQQGGAFAALKMALAYAVALIRFEGMSSLGIWRVAVCDGWIGRLGKKDF